MSAAAASPAASPSKGEHPSRTGASSAVDLDVRIQAVMRMAYGLGLQPQQLADVFRKEAELQKAGESQVMSLSVWNPQRLSKAQADRAERERQQAVAPPNPLMPDQAAFGVVGSKGDDEGEKEALTMNERLLRELREGTVVHESDGHIGWNEFCMQLAIQASLRSKDPKTGVGCVLVDTETHSLRVVSIGYNGLPHGFPDDAKIWTDPDEKLKYCIHDFPNAVSHCLNPEKVRGCTAYVTLYPCHDCAKSMIQWGIKQVIYWSHRRNKAADLEVPECTATNEHGESHCCPSYHKARRDALDDSYERSEAFFRQAGIVTMPFLPRVDPYVAGHHARLDVMVNSFTKQIKMLESHKQRESLSGQQNWPSTGPRTRATPTTGALLQRDKPPSAKKTLLYDTR